MASRGTTLPSRPLARNEGGRRGRLGTGAEVAALAFFFLFYANLAVVASQFHGVPQAIASSIALLLLFPIGKYVVLERQPP